MFGRAKKNEEPPRCSFCYKPKNVVRKLIAGPNDYPRVYICDECVAVCVAILWDDPDQSKSRHGNAESDEIHPLVNHPMVSELLTAVERWVKSSGADSVDQSDELRRLATHLLMYPNERSHQHCPPSA